MAHAATVVCCLSLGKCRPKWLLCAEAQTTAAQRGAAWSSPCQPRVPEWLTWTMSEVPGLNTTLHNSNHYIYLHFVGASISKSYAILIIGESQNPVINHQWYLFLRGGWVWTSIRLSHRQGSIVETSGWLLGCERSVEREFPALKSTNDQNKGLVFSKSQRKRRSAPTTSSEFHPSHFYSVTGSCWGRAAGSSAAWPCLQPETACPSGQV